MDNNSYFWACVDHAEKWVKNYNMLIPADVDRDGLQDYLESTLPLYNAVPNWKEYGFENDELANDIYSCAIGFVVDGLALFGIF